MTVEKPINLALQGGGAHGAFTWGVLDFLLEDRRLLINAVSGTSAGAMNAVVMADGLMRGGREGARQGLDRFWHAVGQVARLSPLQRAPIDVWMGNWSLDNSPAYIWFDMLSRVASPYQLNPFNIDPLRDILDSAIDFDLVRSCDVTRMFISATNVHTGRVTVFNRHELTVDMVLASACLPFVFQAVEIEGVPYWDGGYMGNPVLFPLYGETATEDVVIVQINPIERKGVPRTAPEILNRVNEITFNSSLLKELRAVDFVHRLIEEGKLAPDHYTDVRIHIIEDTEKMDGLGASSKLNAEQAFLDHLRDLGRNAARRWLDRNFEEIGNSSTVNVRDMFQGVNGAGG